MSISFTRATSYWTIPKDVFPLWVLEHIGRSSGFDASSENFTVYLAYDLLPEMTSDELRKHTLDARNILNFNPTNLMHYCGSSLPVQRGISVAAYIRRELDPNAEDAREFIRDMMQKKHLMTLTHMETSSQGKDTLIHDFNLPTAYRCSEEFLEKLIGISKIQDPDYNYYAYQLDHFRGTAHKGDVPCGYERPYLWKSNRGKESDYEICKRVGARKDACLDMARINCSWGPNDKNFSLAVRIVHEGSAKR